MHVVAQSELAKEATNGSGCLSLLAYHSPHILLAKVEREQDSFVVYGSVDVNVFCDSQGNHYREKVLSLWLVLVFHDDYRLSSFGTSTSTATV